MFHPSEKRRVRPRKIWQHEARDFTPWLSENLAFLAGALNIELAFEAREKKVGEFRADLVCRNPLDNSRIVIENQLDESDHSHLGQVLTYAAGLQAVTIIWISEKFRDAHRLALDWHNEITDMPFRFFGLELQTWEDEGSGYTADFNVIAKPADWIPTGWPGGYQIRR